MVKTLDIILGPMFSGKTSKLLEIVNNFKSINQKDNSGLIFILKPDIDRRYEESEEISHIISHDKIKHKCYLVNDIMRFQDYILSSCRTEENLRKKDIWILIDEGQFFKDLRKFCETLFKSIDKDKNIKIVVSGLDGDFERNPIGEILTLIPISDSVVKLKGKCDFCSNQSIFSKRICDGKEQVLIGGNNIYKPVCRLHYWIFKIIVYRYTYNICQYNIDSIVITWW